MDTPGKRHLINVLEASLAGQSVQRRLQSRIPAESHEWRDTTLDDAIDTARFLYRIKPQPRTFWLVEIACDGGFRSAVYFERPQTIARGDKVIRVQEVIEE